MIGGVVGGAVAEAPAADGVPVYPKARRGDQVDDYHGLKVPDPYRWLEDSDSPETRAWIDAENKITQAYLAQIPARDKIGSGSPS
jgi:prolyl oligopeptidase